MVMVAALEVNATVYGNVMNGWDRASLATSAEETAEIHMPRPGRLEFAYWGNTSRSIALDGAGLGCISALGTAKAVRCNPVLTNI